MKVERQFGKPERKEALLQNLGIPFVSKYLPDADWNPQLLVRITLNWYPHYLVDILFKIISIISILGFLPKSMY